MPIAARFRVAFAALALMAATPALAQDPIREETVRFDRGASGTTIEASLKGYETVDYIIGASAGQVMNVSMATDNGANYFNVMEPGETDVAIFIGSTSGNMYEGELQKSGDYRIRVYLMRSAARRDEVANYRFEINIGGAAFGGNGSSGSASAGSAERAGSGDFDATGQIPCAQYAGQPMGQCDFGVARDATGEATVIVTRPDGTKRALFFINGAFNSADTSQADGYPEYSATKNADLSVISVGEERYEVPDAVVFGG
ncbi:MAG TPA: hypothetical protein PKE65_01225 [Rhizobiaceae bacterium]|nr:hypothetical protein [Rhizobiaceae bacterium]